MYLFRIVPLIGDPVDVRVNADWSTPGPAQYSGDDTDIDQVKKSLQEGYCPFGRIIADPDFVEPQSIHYAFYSKKGWQITTVEGVEKHYDNGPSNEENDDDTVTADESPLILESVRYRSMSVPLIVADSASGLNWLEEIQEAVSMAQLEEAFYGALEDAKEKPEAVILEPSTGSGHIPFGLKTRKKEAREQLNSAAAEIVSRVKDPAKLTDEEREILVQYTGRGGLTEGAQSEYYTPTPIAEGVWDMLAANGFVSGNVLEPSSGSGVFSATKNKNAILTAVELNPLAASVNALLHPEENNINAAFEQICKETPDNTFDSVVGNVPFGEGRGMEAGIDKENGYNKEIRLERYFVARAIDKVKPGGLVALVVPEGVVRSKTKVWQRWRRKLSMKAEFLGAVKLPMETFGGQGTQGTSVVTDVVLFKKHPADLLDKLPELSEDTLLRSKVIWEEFIAGQWFNKSGKKHMAGQLVKATNEFGKEIDVLRAHSTDNPNRDTLLKNLRQKLAVKFKSRIDWALLESAEAKPHSYVIGDRRYVSGQEYELTDTGWQKVDMEAAARRDGLDPAIYGVDSWAGLNVVLSGLRGPLSLTFNQMAAIHSKWPNKLSDAHIEALEFARRQPEEERDFAFKGVLVGAMASNVQELYNRGADYSTQSAEVCKEINKLIDRYGHPRKHKKIKHSGSGAQSFNAFAQAQGLDGVFTDLFKGSLNTDSAGGYESTNIQSIVEYLFRQSDDQTIQPEEVAALYDGNLDINSLGALAEFDGVYLTGNGFVQPESAFLSGDVYKKMDALFKAAAKESDPRIKDKYAKQIEKLKQARTYDKLDSVRVTMADAWLDRSYILQFLTEIGETGFSYYNTDEEYDDAGNVTLTTEDFDTSRRGGKFRVPQKNPKGIRQQILNYLNKKAVQGGDLSLSASYRDDIRALNDQFHQWLQQHPDADQIEEQYNRTFHPDLPREYSDKPLDIDNLSDGVKLHGYQSQAIRRLSEEGRGVMGFGVGLGKTFTALALAKYNEQMGRANRTCTVVPKSVLANWFHEAKAIYGDMAGTLFVGVTPVMDKDGTPEMEPVIEEGKHKINKHTKQPEYQTKLKVDSAEEIRAKLWSIPQSSGIRRVVMADSVFSRIPLRMETITGYADDWVERGLLGDSEAGKFAARRLGGGMIEDEDDEGSGKKKKKSSSWAKISKEQRLKQKYVDEGTSKTESYPYYEDMAFDSVIVDEAHNYKNIYSPGREANRIAYLSAGAVADKATDMAIKMAHLRKKNSGRGPVLLTATPLTNSPLEVFNALSLVTDLSEFEKMGITNADDFIRTFGRTENRMRENLQGELVEVDALVGFSNLTALRSTFYRYVHQRTADDVFKGENKVCKAPEAKEQRDYVGMTSTQEAVYLDLRRDAQMASLSPEDISFKISIGELPATYVQRPLFSVLRDMERVSTDPDMYFKQMTFTFPVSKKKAVEAMLGKMKESVTAERYDIVQEKQVKVSIPKEYEMYESGKKLIIKIAQEWEPEIEKGVSAKKSGLSLDEIGHPVSPKYAKLVENVQLHVNNNGKQIIFTEEKTQHHKIARMLGQNVEGLALEEIGFINGTDTNKDTKLQAAADNFNTGRFRVIICNKKAEVGVNLQKGTTAIHHLTLPYTPASIEQRNGRGVRQGNIVDTVDVYFYLAQSSSGQSMDERRLDIIQSKSRWIDQVMKGQSVEADNADATDDDSSSYLDLLVDDPEERERRIQAGIAKREAEARKRAEKKASTELGKLVTLNQQLAAMGGGSGGVTERDESEKNAAEIEKLERELESTNRPFRMIMAVWLGGTVFAGVRVVPEEWAAIEKDYIKGRSLDEAKKELEAQRKDLSLRIKELKGGNVEDSAITEKREKLEAKINAAKTALKLIDKAGHLPFDKEFIDRTEGVTVLPDGRVVSEGQYYEYDSGHTVYVLQVGKIDLKKRKIDFTGIVGSASKVLEDYLGLKHKMRAAGCNSRELTFPVFAEQTRLKLTSYTDQDLEILKMKEEKLSYRQLVQYSRDLFMAHCTVKDNVRGYSGLLYRRGGKLMYSSGNDDVTNDELVWPERGNEQLKKELAEMKLAQMEEKGSLVIGHSEREILRLFFDTSGSTVEDIIRSYGTQATEQDVKAAVWAEFEAVKKEDKESFTNPSDAYTAVARSYYTRIQEAGYKLGVNEKDIKVWSAETVNAITSELREAKAIYDAAEKEAKQGAAKAADKLPDYDEVKPSERSRSVIPEKQPNGRWRLRMPFSDRVTDDGLLTDVHYYNARYEITDYATKEDAIKAAESSDLYVYANMTAYKNLKIGEKAPEKQIEAEPAKPEQPPEPKPEIAPDDVSGGSEGQTGGLTAEQLGRFAMLSIKARVVAESVAWKSGRYNNRAEANSIWLQSTEDSGGVLRKYLAGRRGHKDEYNAKYGADPMPTMPGSWWYLPSDADIDKLLSAMEAA